MTKKTEHNPSEPTWWRKRADEIEAQVAATGSSEAMRCYTDMRTLLQAAAAPQDPSAAKGEHEAHISTQTWPAWWAHNREKCTTPRKAALAAWNYANERALHAMAANPAPADDLAADVEAVLGLLEEHEWAEHCTKTPLGQRLEAAITELHNEIHAAEDAPYAAAPAVTIDPASFEGLIAAVRSLPTTRATEFDGEESDGTPQRWRNRPFVSRTQLERLLQERVAEPAARLIDDEGHPSDELRDLITGMTVSVDVSTGDHDAGNRLFGEVTEVMEYDGGSDKHKVVLLVQSPEANFKAAPAAPSVNERAAYIEFLTGKFPRSYGKEEAGRWWDQGHVSALAWQAARAVAAAPTAPEVDAPIVWPKARDVGRIGDMSPSAHLRIGLDSDNDVWASIWDERGGATIEFCTPGQGGGKSSRTRMALLAVMVAMEADNSADPGRDWWAERNGAAQAAAKGASDE